MSMIISTKDKGGISMEEQKEEFLGVYREIAAAAIKNWYLWNLEEDEAKRPARTEDEAKRLAREEAGNHKKTTYELDNDDNHGVWGEGSITAAIRSLVAQLGSSQNPESIVKDIYKEDDSSVAKLSEDLQKIENINAMIIQVLSDIHDDWCISNAKKFFEPGRDKQYQHLPLELIGWKEAKNDLVFLSPILQKMGINVDLDQLEREYKERQKQFLESQDLRNKEDVREYVSRGEYIENLSTSLDEGNSKKAVLERTLDYLRKNRQVITKAKKDEKDKIIWRKENGKDVKNEYGDKVPEVVLEEKNVLDSTMDQLDAKGAIAYPAFTLQNLKDEINNNVGQDVSE